MLKYKSARISIKDYKTPIKEIISYSSLVFLLSPIRSRRSSIKLVWIIFLIGFLFGSIYYVTLNILDYLQYDTTTTIYEMNESESEFPTVSFCSADYDPIFDIKIISISFQNEDLTDEWQNHMESFTDNEYGNCYRFNSGYNLSNQSVPIKKVRKSGLDDGFWINIYYNRNETIELTDLMIYIYNYTQMPATIYKKGDFIQSGRFNYFKIKRIYDQKLEVPYNDCYKNVTKSEYNQTIINHMIANKRRIYNQKECLDLCDNLKYKEMNPCSFIPNNLDQNIIYESRKLKNKTLIKCIMKFFKQLNYTNEYCPYECDSFTFDINTHSVMTQTSGNISSKSLSYFSGFKTYENVSRTFFALRVYYEDLKYTLIKQQAKIELFGLISNVGGTLGLFIGFSFISLLEIFEVLAELFCIKFSLK
jgi:hypothetical protein